MPVNSVYQGKPRGATAPKAKKPRPAPPARTGNPSAAKASATREAKRQDRQEYDRQRNQTPERRESHRLHAQERRRKTKELGICKSCPNPAKPGQTRCPTCTDKHRESRIRSKAKQEAMAEGTEATINGLAVSNTT